MKRSGADRAPGNVIIAGAGPVGLTAALVLAEAGVPVTVLEKRDTLNTASKASTFHPPTLAILDRLGVLGAVVAEGAVADRIQYRTATDGVFAEFRLDTLTPETRYPFRLHLEQSRVTAVMRERLRGFPHATISFRAEVVDAASADAGVTARVRDGDAESDVAASFLIGADGSRSQVRAALGISFDGEDYPDKILRVMTRDDLDGLLPGIAPVTYVFNAGKSASFLKMPDCWRIILRVPKEVDDDLALSPDWILARLREVIPACETLPGVAMKDVYGVSKRVAGAYRSGRIYLAGDSAHLTNTRGGMNMNCGIHDGYAVAQAMVRALRTGSKDAVDAAADGRRRIATDFLIPRTDRNVHGGQAWLDHIRATAADPAAALSYLRTAAMLDIAPSAAEPTRSG